MPNWCECELKIIGKEESLKNLLAKVTDNEILDARKIIPYPEEYRLLDEAAEKWEKDNENNIYNKNFSNKPKDGFNSGGYEWCIEHWGTKWGFCNQEKPPKKTSRSLLFDFSTAWAPPYPLIKKLSEMFPDLHFKIKYWECGAAYQGKTEYKNGKEISKIEKAYYGRRGG